MLDINITGVPSHNCENKAKPKNLVLVVDRTSGSPTNELKYPSRELKPRCKTGKG